MRPHDRDEVGETLIEVLISLVVIGVVVGAFFAAIATTSTASKSQRDLVTADAVLRAYAEATKNQVQDTGPNGCGHPNPTTFTVDFPPSGYTIPTNFSVSSTPSLVNQPCPPVTSAQLEQLTVTMPNGRTKSLDIEVRTP
jgi:type II secretory pathway pseudopilin PulG